MRPRGQRPHRQRLLSSSSPQRLRWFLYALFQVRIAMPQHFSWFLLRHELAGILLTTLT
jgi:hypothetical protein